MAALDIDMSNVAAHSGDANSAATYPPPDRVAAGAHIATFDEYKRLYAHSIEEPTQFWASMARKHLTWFRDFTEVYVRFDFASLLVDARASSQYSMCRSAGSFETGDIRWFTEGQLNVCYNCVDRHVVEGRGENTAIIWDGDEVGTTKSYTYSQLLQEVCRVANVLTYHGVRKGDTVAIYMPMIPDLAFAMLACARIGAVHRYACFPYSSSHATIT
jgi:acetyl-CoA synthetase